MPARRRRSRAVLCVVGFQYSSQSLSDSVSMHSSSCSILSSIRSRLSCCSIFHHAGSARPADRDAFVPAMATRQPSMTARLGLLLRIPTRHRSFCQVFRGLRADCLLEMNRPFSESRKTVFSGFLIILFSFRFDRPDDRIVRVNESSPSMHRCALPAGRSSARFVPAIRARRSSAGPRGYKPCEA
jgi:hypothetical protein